MKTIIFSILVLILFVQFLGFGHFSSEAESVEYQTDHNVKGEEVKQTSSALTVVFWVLGIIGCLVLFLLITKFLGFDIASGFLDILCEIIGAILSAKD